jgi:hypothetical protein
VVQIPSARLSRNIKSCRQLRKRRVMGFELFRAESNKGLVIVNILNVAVRNVQTCPSRIP